MNSNFTVSISLLLKGAAEASAGIGKFSGNFSSSLGKVRKEAQMLWQDLNGYSTATKLLAAAGGISMMKGILDANLALEKTMMQLKWNAQMTKAEIAEIRKMSLDLAIPTLNKPQLVADMMFRLGNAGLKLETIKAIAPQIAAAAPVFGANPDALADLAFDLITKQGIREDRLAHVFDMLYYHATSGRFETTAMAQEAPKLLNVGKQVGIVGEEGANLLGALTQRMMRNATVSVPSEVSTITQEGVAHIFSPHYIKGLKKFGIHVENFFDKQGHFLGEGGAEGLIGLTRAMKKAGLQNPLKMAQAGFREHNTQLFWREMMASLDADDSDKDPNLIKMMERGRAAKKSGQLAKNLEDAKQSNYGKILKAEIAVDKTKLSDGSGKGVDFYSRLAEGVAEHKGEVLGAGAAAVGLYALNRFNKNRRGRLAEQVSSAAAAASVQQVFVTNWPGQPLASAPGVMPGEAPANAPNSKWGKVMKGLGGLAAAGIGWEIGYNVIGPVANMMVDALVQTITGKTNATLGTSIYDALHKEKEASKTGSKQVVNGLIHVKVEGPASVVSVKSSNPDFKFNAYAGHAMVTQ